MKAPHKDGCFEDIRVYEFFEAMRYLEATLLWEDAHDEMFEMIMYSDQEGKNDSIHRLYRHWIKGERLQQLFDVICFAFDIEHDIMTYHDGTKEDTTKIVFWVSW
jgi:hypothetical protein